MRLVIPLDRTARQTRRVRATIGTLATILTALSLASCGQKPAEVRVSPQKLVLYGFDRGAGLKAEVLDTKGRPMPAAKVEWTSANPKIAVVDATAGSLTSKGSGKTTLTATLVGSDLSGKVRLEVIDVSIASIVPNRTTIAGPAGTRFKFSAEAKDSKGKPVSLPIRWTSSDPKVVSVDDKGNAVSVTEGKASVVATFGDVAASAETRVVFREIGSLEATPLLVPLKVGETARVTVLVRDKGGALIENAAATWSTSEPRAATCAGGIVLGVGQGSATIRAECGGKSAEVSVIVN
jgi:hypothetical protein